MSLHARIAIGASRRALAFECFAMIGGLAVVTATAYARSASWAALAIGIVATGLVAASGVRSWRAAHRDDLLVVDASVRVELHRAGSPQTDHLELAEGSVAWPGLSVLNFVPAPFSSAPARRLVAFRGDLGRGDWRGLRRHLLWIGRGGARPDPVTDRSS